MYQIREWVGNSQRVVYEDLENLNVAYHIWKTFRDMKPNQVFSIYLKRVG